MIHQQIYIAIIFVQDFADDDWLSPADTFWLSAKTTEMCWRNQSNIDKRLLQTLETGYWSTSIQIIKVFFSDFSLFLFEQRFYCGYCALVHSIVMNYIFYTPLTHSLKMCTWLQLNIVTVFWTRLFVFGSEGSQQMEIHSKTNTIYDDFSCFHMKKKLSSPQENLQLWDLMFSV